MLELGMSRATWLLCSLSVAGCFIWFACEAGTSPDVPDAVHAVDAPGDDVTNPPSPCDAMAATCLGESTELHRRRGDRHRAMRALSPGRGAYCAVRELRADRRNPAHARLRRALAEPRGGGAQRMPYVGAQ